MRCLPSLKSRPALALSPPLSHRHLCVSGVAYALRVASNAAHAFARHVALSCNDRRAYFAPPLQDDLYYIFPLPKESPRARRCGCHILPNEVPMRV